MTMKQGGDKVQPKDDGIEGLTRFAMEMIRRTGEQALSYYGKGKAYLKFDEGLVTEAELHLRELFQDQLYAQFPDHQVYSSNEGYDGYTHEGRRYVWIYDALDGVANFQAGIPVWGTSVALIENFWPLFGVFYMPATKDIFHGRAGQKAFRGEEEMRISQQESINDESVLLTYSRFHQDYYCTFPGKVRTFGCTAAHVCYVAMGRAEAAIIANESYKDLAAASVIIEAAGGSILKMDGTPLFLSDYCDGRRIDEHLLVTVPEKYAEVASFLERVY
jgi:myo-inositol-1(or 4)-monophosphatase